MIGSDSVPTADIRPSPGDLKSYFRKVVWRRVAKDRSITFERARAIIKQEHSVILLFGTAWGLDKTFMTMTDHVLEPISGRNEYNHLSVRTAAAIILDRLVGRD